ncbi:hypothetical protein LTR10_011536 [Elasticomyces elasticus]|uniref:Alpha-N-acetylglucosaminidase n=1 Tax=Exophiala sideris TaxID=1016849 RepID=A0ABR0JCQ5_9EURO|nr:hypothetical protein LTR10_011536 [Elasticomyces elasticus]KAK5032006.1 hypothetical protein LTS07_004628 [Exophiala sideris]KAK5040935.1 hypothetical protein LTR13_003237 [Exophiala sideris]KAK5061731.1 hypothetical protein LTR69_004913 [Exophiala sideris]KAK5184431.1 hypothetical protein LTR44_003104 [Eurotiomycetes sp. CCFEE 6388]
MRWFYSLSCLYGLLSLGEGQSTQGLVNLVKRRLPAHVDDFSFELAPGKHTPGLTNDQYTVKCDFGKVSVQGNSLSALLSGLHRYLTDVAHVDIYWFIGSQLDKLQSLPRCASFNGSSIVPWRYHFNTVTFSYTAAFWSWEDWEDELDWLALRGVNLPLAWNGFEKILVEVFEEMGLSQPEIFDFLSGPAFQAWNRFGNIQGSWGGQLPMAWINSQFDLQKQILQRMTELGMTPVLPAFTGFVPRTFPDLYPNASVVNISQWSGFPTQYTNDTFLDPSDPLFARMQKSFITKQQQYYGNVSSIYTLDQFNENDPISGDLTALEQLSYTVWQSLKAADPNAIWMLQGWLFFSNSDFWTNDRVEAFLGGVTKNTDMLILDLFSETQPQWQRLDSYYGKPWIWCELHGYGGNQGLYGQVMNVTINPISALANSSSLVGFGLTMEGQEGNEIMYDLLLDQAWSGSPIDLTTYFHNWATTRYSNATQGTLPPQMYQTWDALLHSVYNNTNLTAAQAVTKSIYELAPNATGLLNRTGHHPTTITYNTTTLVKAWQTFISAANSTPSLWANEAYQFDLIDITRQVLANAFNPVYSSFVTQTNLTALHNANTSALNASLTAASHTQSQLLALLTTLNGLVCLTPSSAPESSLPSWVSAARAWADSNSSVSDFYAFDAVNQVTLWGPTGQISDYASRQWCGLISGYYLPRWQTFTGTYLNSLTTGQPVNQTQLQSQLLTWEEQQQGPLA